MSSNWTSSSRLDGRTCLTKRALVQETIILHDLLCSGFIIGERSSNPVTQISLLQEPNIYRLSCFMNNEKKKKKMIDLSFGDCINNEHEDVTIILICIRRGGTGESANFSAHASFSSPTQLRRQSRRSELLLQTENVSPSSDLSCKIYPRAN